MAAKRHDRAIDVLRGVAILMVLLLHSSFAFQGAAHELLSWLQALSAPAVLIFFFCSGCCLPPRGSRAVSSASLRPMARLLVAALFWCALLALIAQALCLFMSRCPWGSGFIVPLDLAQIPGSPVAFQLYFLFALAGIRALDLVFFQSPFVGRFTFDGLHCLLALAFLIAWGFPSHWHGGSWANFNVYLFAFGLGRVLGRCSSWQLPVPVVALLVASCLGFVADLLWSEPGILGLFLLPGFLWALLAFAHLVSEHSLAGVGQLAAIGLVSGGIFLIHAPFLSSALFALESRLLPVGTVVSLVLYLLLLLGSSLLLVQAARRWLPAAACHWLLLVEPAA